MKTLSARILLFLLTGLILHTFTPTFVLAEKADEDFSRNGQSETVVQERGAGLSNKNAPFWFERGSLYATYGNGAAAVASFKKAIAVDPEFAEAYFNMGVVYGEMGAYQKALDAINHAISFKPETGRYYYGRGWNYLRSGSTEQAMTDIRKAAGLGDLEAKKYLENIAPRN